MDFGQRRYSDGKGMMQQLTPVVKWLLITNITIYLVDTFFFRSSIRGLFAFTIQSAILDLRLWEFISFQFLHGHLPHVLFNSVTLFFFGPWMERYVGAKRFLIFYLLCGAAGATFFAILVFLGVLPDSYLNGLVGASAGIYGILVGVAFVAPSMRVALLFPPITLSMRQLALALLAISAGSILLRIGGNEGGEAGHLGGAIMGFFLMKFFTKSSTPKRRKGGSPGDYTPKIRPRTTLDLHASNEIDSILEKISRDGFQSLTEAERGTLQQAAKQNDTT